MRTTVTLDPDTEQLVRRWMADRDVSFKRALNDAIRAGARQRAGAEAFRTTTASLGVPSINLDAALRIAGELEDEELISKMRRGA